MRQLYAYAASESTPWCHRHRAYLSLLFLSADFIGVCFWGVWISSDLVTGKPLQWTATSKSVLTAIFIVRNKTTTTTTTKRCVKARLVKYMYMFIYVDNNQAPNPQLAWDDISVHVKPNHVNAVSPNS